MRNKKILVIFIGLLIGAILTSCNPSTSTDLPSNGSSEQVRTISDAAGRSVTIPQTIESVVCVNVGALRFTCYMGAEDLVVGVEQNEHDPAPAKLFSYVNKELFASLPHTGDNGTTYDEAIISLSPDVIVAAVDKGTADDLQQKLKIPVVAIPLVDSVFDEAMFDTIELLGELYEKTERAKELTDYLKGLKSDLKQRTANINEADKPSVYVGGLNFKGARDIGGTEADYPPFAAISANNLAAETGQTGAITIEKEQVLSWDPDILFLDFSGLALIKEDYAKNPDFYESLSAVKNNRVYSQIPFRFNAVNLEIALADTYYAGKVIFPDQFYDIDPEEKADEIYEMMLGIKCVQLLKDAGYEFGEINIAN